MISTEIICLHDNVKQLCKLKLPYAAEEEHIYEARTIPPPRSAGKRAGGHVRRQCGAAQAQPDHICTQTLATIS